MKTRCHNQRDWKESLALLTVVLAATLLPIQKVVAEEDQFANLVRGPYLQNLTSSNLVICWRTDVPVHGVVRFAAGNSIQVWQVMNPDLATNHFVTVTNLAPDTIYRYEIATSTDTLSEGLDHFFITGPATQRPTRLWVIGDSGSATVGAKAVYERYREFTGNRYTDAWLMLGDNAYGVGADREYQRAVFEMYPELLRQTVAWSTIGNHETYSVEQDGNHAYFKIFDFPKRGQAGGEPSGTENYYSFDYGNIHVVCLDSEKSARTPGQQFSF